ncbi:MAG: hypothetical protein KGJ08_01450 [Gammaproteobacteria bacterium]|nr:hypothetical protein [Gammaproteobacteria bacterium]
MNDNLSDNDKGLAASLALGKAGKGQKISARTADYLDEQIALSRIQREHLEHTRTLHEENLKLQSKVLRSQHKQLRSQYLHDRMRTVYQSVLSLVALAVLAVIVYGVIDALRDQSVVVNQFQVPPGFAAVGNNGTVVASDFLDQLHILQVATRSQQTSLVVQDAWSNDIKLQVPNLHVTIGDIRRNLNDWLGHEIQINGDVVQQGTQIAFTVRGTGFIAKTFSGAPNTLPALLTSAAEYVYGQAEPYNFANYLEEHDRDADAITLVQEVYPAASARDRPWLMNAWGNGLADLNQNAAAVDKYREALRLNPKFWIAYANLQNAQIQLGEQEAAYQTGLSMEQHARRGSWFGAHMPELYYSNQDQLRMDLPAVHQELVADETAHSGQGTLTNQETQLDAEMLTRMHALRQAVFILQTAPSAGSDHYVMAATHYVQGLMALDQHNYPQAVNELEDVDTMITQFPMLQSDFNSPPQCTLGLAEELAGHPVKADMAIAKGGSFVDCYSFKGDIAAHRGNWLQAQKDYSAAVVLAPSLPQPYESWGLALLRRGDYQNAIIRFQQANQRGPHWCDPLKYWGDALAAQGNYKDAVKKYALAARYTPGWRALELQWGEALDKLGRHSDALMHYHAAQTE